jgi:hypothetical protein
MVRHGDPGVPNWLVDSGEVSLSDLSRTVEFSTSVTETQLVTYNVSHTVTLQDLIDAGNLDADDDFTDRGVISDAISDFIADDNVDQFDDDDPYRGDSDYYDSEWEVDSYGDEE